MTKIRLAGLDGSLTNFGAALLELDTDSMEVTVLDLVLVKTEKSKTKSVRSSSDNLARAQQISEKINEAIKGSLIAFIEVPSGGQSYHAVLGFGIVIGIYASLCIPTAEVSPGETKIAAVGTRTASKEEMIAWATEKFPNAPWRTKKRDGVVSPTNDNEHLADAIAIALAGLNTPSFKQTLAIIKSSNKIAA